MQRLYRVDEKTPQESSWTPLFWAMKLLSRAQNDGKIDIEAPIYVHLQTSLQSIETCNRKLLSHSWVNFPLAYAQVIYFKINT